MTGKKVIWFFVLVFLVFAAIYTGYSIYGINSENQRIHNEFERQVSVQEEKAQAEAAQMEQLRNQLITGDFGGTQPKIVFLTFDDGPNECSNEVLDILKSHDVKATFFTNGREGEEYEQIYRRIINEGHVLANHTYSHDYDLYYDTDSFLADVKKQEDYLRAVTGVEPARIFRFPGGSTQTSLANVNALVASGYNFYDWTASAGDGSSTPLSVEDTYAKIITEVREDPVAVVLCHAENPAKSQTRAALDGVINDLKAEGYIFMTLDPAYKLENAKYTIPTL